MAVYFSAGRNRWTYDFWYMGSRYQGYCVDLTGLPVTSKTAATHAEDDIRRVIALTTKHVRAHEVTLAQLIADLRPQWQLTPSWDDKKRQIKEITTFFGATTSIREISEARIREYTNFSFSRPRTVWKGGPAKSQNKNNHKRRWKTLRVTRAPATVNRYLSVLRQIFKHALEMRDPITRQPVLESLPTIKDLKEPNRRARPIPEPVLARLLQILPQHTKDAIILTLYFGFRQGEVFSLKEKNVDWLSEGIRLYAEDVKDNEDAFLPGSQEAMGYLRCLAMEAEARHVHHLITYRRSETESWRPLQKARSGWDRAMDTIEREMGCRWRWHDLRAAYITHVALTSGAVTAQALARHSNFETTLAYIDVADEFRRMAAERTAERPALLAARKSLTKVPDSARQGPDPAAL